MKIKKIIFTLLISTFLIFSYGCKKDNTQNNENNTQNLQNGSILNENKNNNPSVEPKDNNANIGVNENTSNNAKYTIKDIYPFTLNTLYTYEGKGNEYASFTVWVDYIKNDKIQLRKNNGGTEIANVIEYKNGELKLVYSKEETYYREDFTSKKPNTDEILLKEPIVKGTSWNVSNDRKRYISNIDIDVDTPLGTFKAVEVTTEGKDFKDIDYYVPQKGLVKSLYTSKDMEVTSSLKKIQNNASLVQTVKFYYPNIDDDKLYYIDKNLTFKTNDITKFAFEKAFKESPNASLGKPLSPNAKINSLYLNNDTVYVDFNKNFITEMNAGSGYESLILQSIVNTLGGYYGVDKVYITIENKPYSSGHIEMKKGEVFKVDTKNLVKLK
ncbi:GerMN domain-containing protein [Clostridium prolinivorans]|uniref:GerMN domain-containing protein n=1 Tax=Clostridium prolinivorans TaxID=2769420 RepID=UPI001D18B67E|nr:GerMN domain-containing protein [Clostridium prolinivorans]